MLAEIRAAVGAGRYNIGPHASIRQMEHDISTKDLETAIGNDDPEVIEDYPADPRGHACLLRGVCDSGVLHVVCKPDDPVFIVSCYRPDPTIWYPNLRERR